MSNNLSTSIQYIKSVGPKRAESFSKIGINTVHDLLFYFPSKYLDRSNIIKSNEAIRYVANGYDGEVTIIGKVLDKEIHRYGRKQLMKVVMTDKEGTFECVWFQGIKYFKTLFNPDEFYAISTKPVLTRYGHLQFTHPDFDKLGKEESDDFSNTGKIIPFYSVPKELRLTNIGDNSLRRIIHNAVSAYADSLGETLPESVIIQHSLPGLPEAIKNIHFPDTQDELLKSKKRFKYEEIFYLECLIALKRNNIKQVIRGCSFQINKEKLKAFLKTLPFELTESQLNVLKEIRSDMESKQPMNRLLQGDVGSGKTIVALISMLIAVHNGYQAALMVPTEILADQHFKKINQMLKNTEVRVSLLLGGLKKKNKGAILEEIRDHKTDIVIGTHALLEENVEFGKIGVVVIDEQHRFGVAQRSKLIFKGISPDVLVMTATPIPRTLTMTVYGDLDLSVIAHKPEDRKPIKTILRNDKKLPDIYKFVVDKVKEGYQSFIIYPLVEESEKLDLKSAEEYYSVLTKTYLKTARVALLHGRMSWLEKEDIMFRFAAKEFDVLVSTTVIEVGIDIPDANIIVINDAFRFGLSQLHQLRGRVGRSDKQAYCILASNIELTKHSSQLMFNFDYMSNAQIEKNKSLIRLNAMAEFDDGFKLSEIDLRLRGPGDIFGTKQSGFPDLKHVNLFEDQELIQLAKTDAFNIVLEDPHLTTTFNRVIKEQLRKSFSTHIYYSLIP